MSKSGRKKNQEERVKSDYSWTDDEVELMVNVTIDYKTAKAMENVDWESCQSKYQDILDKYLEQYPSAEEAIGKDYPHTKEEMTKATLTTKMKSIRQKYRKAVDSGRKSGHGRVVLLYFELCEQIWGGSPASTAISSGIESTDIDELSFADSEEISTATPSPASSFQGHSPDSLESLDSAEDSGERLPSNVVQERRNLLSAKLAGHKQERLKRKLPNDSQLITCAQEELKIKKKILERMEATDKEHSNYMDKMFVNMEKLTNSIADGFALLRQVMLPQPPYTRPPHYFHQNQPSAFMHDGHVNFSSRMSTASASMSAA